MVECGLFVSNVDNDQCLDLTLPLQACDCEPLINRAEKGYILTI